MRADNINTGKHNAHIAQCGPNLGDNLQIAIGEPAASGVPPTCTLARASPAAGTGSSTHCFALDKNHALVTGAHLRQIALGDNRLTV